jgi:hypothetical protein
MCATNPNLDFPPFFVKSMPGANRTVSENRREKKKSIIILRKG